MTIILGLLRKFKTNILLTIAVIGAIWSAYEWAYGNGYSKAVSDNQEAVSKLQAELQLQYVEKVNRALQLQSDEFDAILKLERESKLVETKVETVTKYVDKIQIKTECNELADSVGRVLVEANSITRSSAGSAESSDK